MPTLGEMASLVPPKVQADTPLRDKAMAVWFAAAWKASQLGTEPVSFRTGDGEYASYYVLRQALKDIIKFVYPGFKYSVDKEIYSYLNLSRNVLHRNNRYDEGGGSYYLIRTEWIEPGALLTAATSLEPVPHVNTQREENAMTVVSSPTTIAPPSSSTNGASAREGTVGTETNPDDTMIPHLGRAIDRGFHYDPDAKTLTCIHCGAVLDAATPYEARAARAHAMRHTMTECEVCHEPMPSPALGPHMRVVHPTVYGVKGAIKKPAVTGPTGDADDARRGIKRRCAHCGRPFRRPGAAKNHEKSCTSPMLTWLPCPADPACPRDHTTGWGVQQHVQLKHPEAYDALYVNPPEPEPVIEQVDSPETGMAEEAATVTATAERPNIRLSDVRAEIEMTDVDTAWNLLRESVLSALTEAARTHQRVRTLESQVESLTAELTSARSATVAGEAETIAKIRTIIERNSYKDAYLKIVELVG